MDKQPNSEQSSARTNYKEYRHLAALENLPPINPKRVRIHPDVESRLSKSVVKDLRRRLAAMGVKSVGYNLPQEEPEARR